MGIDWKALKREYLEADYSLRELSRRFGCHPSTISKRARREGWSRPGKSAPPGRRPGECVLDDHIHLLNVAWRKVERGLKNKDAKLGLDELRVAKMAGEVLPKLIEERKRAICMGEENKGRGLVDAQRIAGEMDSLTVSQDPGETLER